jgi:hypothetical protein
LQVGEHFSLVFENHDTVLLQVQEMLRTERITDEHAIAHELATYNELSPKPGSLSATLFVEYDDPVERKRMLPRLTTLRQGVHLVIGDARSTAKLSAQAGEEQDRLPAVNFALFEVGADVHKALREPSTSVRLVIDHPDGAVEADVPKSTREQLARDLAG